MDTGACWLSLAPSSMIYVPSNGACIEYSVLYTRKLNPEQGIDLIFRRRQTGIIEHACPDRLTGRLPVYATVQCRPGVISLDSGRDKYSSSSASWTMNFCKSFVHLATDSAFYRCVHFWTWGIVLNSGDGMNNNSWKVKITIWIKGKDEQKIYLQCGTRLVRSGLTSHGSTRGYVVQVGVFRYRFRSAVGIDMVMDGTICSRFKSLNFWTVDWVMDEWPRGYNP